MRQYGTVSPLFWTGKTGKRLRSDRDAQLVALYLMTNPHSHQTGLYYMPVMYLANETGIPLEGASKALQKLEAEGFCRYDQDTEWVWVCEMAAWQIGTGLKATDKRVLGVQQYLESAPDLPFTKSFVTRYAEDFHLSQTPQKRDSEAPSKGLISNRTRTEQEQRPSKKSGSPSRKSILPEAFDLTDDRRSYAAAKIPDANVPELFESFRGKARAKGWQYVDWDRAWQEFVRNTAPNSGHWSSGQYPKLNGSGLPEGKWM